MITRVMQTDTEKTSRAAGRWIWVSRSIFAVLILATLVFGFFLAAANVGLQRELAEMSDRLDEAQAESGALYEQLLAAGEDPVVTPDEPTSTGVTGPAGAPGSQGVPGRAPTALEIYEAVSAYCASVGGCEGVDGTDGASGTPGTPGANGETIVGPPGPAGPAGESIVGPPGPAGADGADGRGIIDVSCILNEDLSTSFRFTFTDGSADDVTAPCVPAA